MLFLYSQKEVEEGMEVADIKNMEAVEIIASLLRVSWIFGWVVGWVLREKYQPPLKLLGKFILDVAHLKVEHHLQYWQLKTLLIVTSCRVKQSSQN